MKTIHIIIMFFTLGFAACKKDFLQKNPQSSVTAEDFFKTPADLETYTNTLYDILPVGNQNFELYSDIFSDNISTYTGGSETDVMLRGNLSPATVGGWDTLDWGKLRKVNFMLD